MKCPECEKEGKVSKLYVDGIFKTCAGGSQYYYDEDGNYHIHDINRATQRSHCTLGHVNVVEIENKCWCGWSNKK